MAITGKTARRLLPFLNTTDPPELHANYEKLANALDNDAEILKGKLSERSAAKLFGRLFYVEGDATPENNGVLWLDNGTNWVAVNTPANGQVYSGVTARVSGTEYTPSAARSVFVTVEVEVAGGSNKVGVSVFCGGLEIAAISVAEESFQHGQSYGFICPAGSKWKYELLGGAPVGVYSRYLPI